MPRNCVKKSGFTLTEILIVLAIVAVLASLLFTAFNSVRNKARLSSCASNLHQIYLACSMYSIDNSGLIPDYTSQLMSHTASGPLADVLVEQSQQLVDSLQPYIHPKSVWLCLSDNTSHAPEIVEAAGGKFLLTHATSYFYHGYNLSDIPFKFSNLDEVRNQTGFNPITRPLIEDTASCPYNENNHPADNPDYQAYNHAGWWNRIFCDGHVKTFSWDCSDPSMPVEH